MMWEDPEKNWWSLDRKRRLASRLLPSRIRPMTIRNLGERDMRIERMRQKGLKGKGAWEKVFRAVGEADPRPGRVAVGVSGGADSVVLAEALWRWGARPVIWHFDHRWRGRKGAADARWVKAWGGNGG